MAEGSQEGSPGRSFVRDPSDLRDLVQKAAGSRFVLPAGLSYPGVPRVEGPRDSRDWGEVVNSSRPSDSASSDDYRGQRGQTVLVDVGDDRDCIDTSDISPKDQSKDKSSPPAKKVHSVILAPGGGWSLQAPLLKGIPAPDVSQLWHQLQALPHLQHLELQLASAVDRVQARRWGGALLTLVTSEGLSLPHLRMLRWCLGSYNNLDTDVSQQPALPALEVLDLSGSSCASVPQALLAAAPMLQDIRLKGNTSLQILDLSGTAVQRVDVSGCSRLEVLALPAVQTHKTIGRHTLEPSLDVSGCSRLHDLTIVGLSSTCGAPSAVKGWDMLAAQTQRLKLEECFSLDSPADMLGSMTALEELSISCADSCSLEVLDLTSCSGSLQRLKLAGCKGLQELLLPASVSAVHLDSCSPAVELLVSTVNTVRDLQLVNSTATDLSWFAPTCSLQHLGLNCCDLLQQSDLSGCSQLQGVEIRGCKQLQQLTLDPSITKLVVSCSALKVVRLDDCRHLLELDFSGCSTLEALPDGICNPDQEPCAKLEKLICNGCSSLKQLPESLDSLELLKVLQLQGCTSLTDLPDSLGNLMELEVLDLSGCSSLEYLPDIDSLMSLQDLRLSGCRALPKEWWPRAIGQGATLHDATGLRRLPARFYTFDGLGVPSLDDIAACLAEQQPGMVVIKEQYAAGLHDHLAALKPPYVAVAKGPQGLVFATLEAIRELEADLASQDTPEGSAAGSSSTGGSGGSTLRSTGVVGQQAAWSPRFGIQLTFFGGSSGGAGQGSNGAAGGSPGGDDVAGDGGAGGQDQSSGGGADGSGDEGPSSSSSAGKAQSVCDGTDCASLRLEVGGGKCTPKPALGPSSLDIHAEVDGHITKRTLVLTSGLDERQLKSAAWRLQDWRRRFSKQPPQTPSATHEVRVELTVSMCRNDKQVCLKVHHAHACHTLPANCAERRSAAAFVVVTPLTSSFCLRSRAHSAGSSGSSGGSSGTGPVRDTAAGSSGSSRSSGGSSDTGPVRDTAAGSRGSSGGSSDTGPVRDTAAGSRGGGSDTGPVRDTADVFMTRTLTYCHNSDSIGVETGMPTMSKIKLERYCNITSDNKIKLGKDPGADLSLRLEQQLLPGAERAVEADQPVHLVTLNPCAPNSLVNPASGSATIHLERKILLSALVSEVQNKLWYLSYKPTDKVPLLTYTTNLTDKDLQGLQAGNDELQLHVISHVKSVVVWVANAGAIDCQRIWGVRLDKNSPVMELNGECQFQVHLK